MSLSRHVCLDVITLIWLFYLSSSSLHVCSYITSPSSPTLSPRSGKAGDSILSKDSQSGPPISILEEEKRKGEALKLSDIGCGTWVSIELEIQNY